jgi:hypothetical protein
MITKEKAAQPSLVEIGPGPEEQIPATPLRDLTDVQLEQIVERGKSAYQEVGAALDEIHRRGSYKTQYGSFKRYLEERWGFSRAHAYRLIAAYRFAEMAPIGDKPSNEHQARKRRSPRASNKITSLPGDSSPQPDGIVTDTEAELEAFKRQMTRWRKFLSIEDEFLFLEKIAQIVDDRLTELNDRSKGVAA